MSIIDQAKAELARINFGDEDTAVMVDLLERFFDQWNSGGAVSVAWAVLQRQQYWQNRRCTTVFKDADGRAYNIDTPGRPTITFPYWPDRSEVPSPVVKTNKNAS